MAEIIQIKQDGVDQYPITKPECVIDENGQTIQQMMAKWGVVSQKQTWTKDADGGYDYVMSDLVRGWIPQANIDLFVSAGAVFNEETGYFELNGLTDISYQEMQKISQLTYSPNAILDRIFAFTSARTHFPLQWYAKWNVLTDVGGSVATNAFINSDFEVILMPPTNYRIPIFSTVSSIMHGGKYIKRVVNAFGYTVTATNAAFSSFCLEEIRLYQQQSSVKLSSPRLSTDSILYMIENEAATSVITITLHATAHARAMADTRITSALETHTNITLAEA